MDATERRIRRDQTKRIIKWLRFQDEEGVPFPLDYNPSQAADDIEQRFGSRVPDAGVRRAAPERNEG